MPDLNVFDRTADLVTTHPLASLIAALLLGLAAPARLRGLVQRSMAITLVVIKWTVLLALSLMLAVYMVPLGIVCLAVHLTGFNFLPDESARRDGRQLSLPFDR
jgi:hypothetical protein